MAETWHQHPRDCKPGQNGYLEPDLKPGEVYDCPGDPLCPYTDLARKEARETKIPAMWRLSQLWPGSPKDLQKHWETMYRAVCAVKEHEVMEPVENYEWPDLARGDTELRIIDVNWLPGDPTGPSPNAQPKPRASRGRRTTSGSARPRRPSRSKRARRRGVR